MVIKHEIFKSQPIFFDFRQRLRIGLKKIHEPTLNPDLLYIYMPPLTARTCPVIYPDASDAKKTTALAISSALPNLSIGIWEVSSARTLSDNASVMAVA